MRNFTIITAVLLSFLSFSVNARPLIADLSLRSIEIDSKFSGTEILLFGARNDAGDVVVVVRGPELEYILRKKERIAGVWANKKQVNLYGINSFYSAASSRELEGIRNKDLLASLNIGIENISFDMSSENYFDRDEFKKAFLDDKERDKLYMAEIGDVSFIGDTLFRTIIKFPDNIPRGTYTAEVYLFSDGQLMGVQSTPLLVKKTGFDAFIFDLAYEHSFLYGIMAVLLALTAGWVAGSFFRTT